MEERDQDAETTTKLEQLFRACDTKGTGYIGRQELSELCAGLGIGPADSDTLFVDLDHDGDDRIDFGDFVQGFRDYITNPTRDVSSLAAPSSSIIEEDNDGVASLVEYGEVVSRPEDGSASANHHERRRHHPRLKSCRSQQSSNDIWKTVLNKINSSSTKSISATNLEELQAVMTSLSSSSKMSNCFETVVQSLLTDMQRLQCDNERLEEIYRTEKSKHETHLRQIEEEIDAHVQKVEEKLKEQMRVEAEMEIKALKTKMDSEIGELQSHLKIFQTFDSLLKKDRNEEDRVNAIRSRLEEASSENRKLRMTLTDTQTNIALMHSELAHLRSQYEDKCRELHSERESSLECIEDQDHLARQLHLLQSANKRLQDANDSIRTVMESNQNLITSQYGVPSSDADSSSPPVKKAKSIPNVLNKRGSIIGDYMRSGDPQDNTIGDVSMANNFGVGVQSGVPACRPVHEIQAEQQSDSMYSSLTEELQLPQKGEMNFGIKRFMEDLDSGMSTARDLTEIEEEQPQMNGDNILRRISVLTNTDLELEHVTSVSGMDGHTEENTEDSTTSGWALLPVGPPIVSTSRLGRHPNCRRSSSRQSLSMHDLPSKTSPFQNNSNKNLNANNNSSGPLCGELTKSCFEATGPPDRMYKVVFAGDAAVGKTTFIVRISKGFFVSTLMSTLGVDFHVKTIRVDEKNVSLQLWDTAGQERFRSVTKSYFRRADGVMLLYDCTSEHSFLNVRDWMAAIDDVAEKRIPIMLCANKIDLRETALLQGKSIVRTDDGERLARDFSAIFIETSAKSGKNVVDALIQLTREMSSNEDLEVQTSGLRVTDMMSPKKGACCGK